MTQARTTERAGRLGLLGLVLWLSGCGARLPEGTLVLTQIPRPTASPNAEGDLLDQRFPIGSRVVLVLPPYRTNDVRLLSSGFIAAGEPAVSADGKQILFAGKTRADGPWQICEARSDGGPHKIVTAMPGGAMDPAILPAGDLVFASPVPVAGQTWVTTNPAALYVQSPGGVPRRLTFGAAAAVEPTVLRDGRILFVSARPKADAAAVPDLALFTVNNDGTEYAAFALDDDGASIAHRPRELRDGRVVYLTTAAGTPGPVSRAVTVQESRPFGNRALLLSRAAPENCGSVEAETEATALACLQTAGPAAGSATGAFVVYRVRSDSGTVSQPVFADPTWNSLEAALVAPRAKPMGHLSAVNATLRTGIILCLDANRTVVKGRKDSPATADRVRILAASAPGRERSLGEVRVQVDGSFMARVPADTPLGFEALDAEGRVLRRLPASIWVRPGENRTCIGCHEPRGRAPRNHRPMAVNAPLASLDPEPGAPRYTRHSP